MEELKRLDRCVQFSGTLEVLCAGIGGVLIFGLGMCFAMQILELTAELMNEKNTF